MEPDAKAKETPQKPASGKRYLLVIVLVGATAAASATVSALVAPGLISKASAAHHSSSPAEAEGGNDPEEEKEEKKGEPAPAEALVLDPLIVDVRHRDEIHHLKVGMAIEMKDHVPEEELKKIVPRARDAAITYLRALTLDEVMDPKQFERIKKELTERVKKGVAKPRVKTVLFTDFVAQ